MTDDPIAFVRLALEGLPDDPADACDDDLETLASVEAGLTRRSVAARHRAAEFVEAMRTGSISFDDGTDEHEALKLLGAQLTVADVLLAQYSRPAVAARGADLDAAVRHAESLSHRKA